MTLRPAFVAVMLAAATAGCNGALDAHLAGVYGGNATPTPTPVPSGSGLATCVQGGGPTASPGADIVLMTSAAAGATVPTYGLIFGYIANDSLANPTPPSFQAQTISVSLSQRQYTAVQFLNADATGVRAAAGIAGGSFPTSYAFITAAAGTAIAANGMWATGPIAPGCYSTAFTLPATPGAFLFGDPNGYANTSSPVRDVLQVIQ